MTLCSDSLELLCTLCVKSLHLIENHERIVRITAEVNYCISICISSERCSMSLAVALVALVVGCPCALSHHALSDDEGWTVSNCLCLVKSLADLVAVVTVDCNDMPSP